MAGRTSDDRDDRVPGHTNWISGSWPRPWWSRPAREGVELIGPGGLLTGLTKSVLETAVEEEISEHLGYDKHDPVGRNGGNSRNGHSGEDGAHRDRAGEYRGAPRSGRLV